jgi:hypothetical protein
MSHTVLYKEHEFSPKSDWVIRDLKDILEDIKSDDTLKKATDAVRNASSKPKKDKIKAAIPSFFPCLDPNNTTDHVSNGVMQFDLEHHDHSQQDLTKIKQFVDGFPHTIYSFTSPSGGLKFAIQTDFHKHFSYMDDRYKAAYALAHDQITKIIIDSTCNFTNDQSTKSMTQGCNLSFDPHTYTNLEPKTYKIDHEAIRRELDQREKHRASNIVSSSVSTTTADEQREEVLFYLEGVPHNSPYEVRLKVNYTLLHYFGSAGVEILMQHWTSPDRNRLRRQIESQLKNVTRPALHYLKSVSANYAKVKATDSGFASALPIQSEFEDRQDATAARQEVFRQIDQFLAHPTDTIIKAPCGIGKSTHIAKRLAETTWPKKVLYLSPTHALGMEIRAKVMENVRAANAGLGIRRKFINTQQIFGRHGTDENGNPLCEDEHARKNWLQLNAPIPSSYCRKECMHFPCRYIEQFTLMDNIRFATHHNLKNEPSNWERGYKTTAYGIKPKTSNWKPDFMVIDESFFSSARYELFPNCPYPSLATIAQDVIGGTDLVTAVQAVGSQLIADSNSFAANQLAAMTSGGTQLKNFLSSQPQSIEYFFQAFESILKAGTADKHRYEICLDNLGEPITASRLIADPISRIHDRFSKVPKLIFDATGNKDLFAHILPKAKFFEVSARPSEGFKVYQCQNKLFSKRECGDKALIDELVSDIDEKIRTNGFTKVGIISYKYVANISPDATFPEHLAKKLTAAKQVAFNHFGNIRGLNAFDDCDALFVVGRYAIHPSTSHLYAQQIFKTVTPDTSQGLVSRSARVNEDDAAELTSYDYTDPGMQLISDSFGMAETIQAIFRLRPFSKKAKTIFYYSKHALGGDVSIDGFFDFADPQLDEIMQNFDKHGFVKNKKVDLMRFGFSDSQARAGRKENLISLLQLRGIRVYEVCFREGGKDQCHQYLVKDLEKLHQHFESSSAKNVLMKRRYS